MSDDVDVANSSMVENDLMMSDDDEDETPSMDELI